MTTPSPPTSPTPLFGPPGLRGQFPTVLTGARLLLAAVCFGVLATIDLRAAAAPAWLLVAAALFVVASVTDALDGWLARRWNAVSIVGRVLDPFADKVLVLGTAVLLAGPPFAVDGRLVSGLAPWMAVAIVARELFVTSLRGVCEARGVDFSASLGGKAKMVVQSVGLPAILVLAAAGAADVGEWAPLAPRVNAGIAWTIVGVTLLSAIPYATRAFAGLRSVAPDAPRDQ